MWMILGAAAILAAILNIIWHLSNKDAKWFRFLSLSLTALTLCAFYGMNTRWVLAGDWSALMDVVPGTSTALWIITILSIALNSISLFKKSAK